MPTHPAQKLSLISSAGLPTAIGKFRVIERLGAGGAGEVFRAVSTQEGSTFAKEVAIKRVIPAYSADESISGGLEREAKLGGLLNHPNIVQTYDLLNVDGNLHVVMEYVAGKTLRQLISQVTTETIRLPLEHSLFIAIELCKALHYAHTAIDPATGIPLKIVHRDLSPENIMVSYEGAVKILDFGIAKHTHSASHTQAGLVRGKLRYLSPEQFLGEPMDHHVDIFACGLILHELVVGHSLLDSSNDAGVCRWVYDTAQCPEPKACTPSDCAGQDVSVAICPDGTLENPVTSCERIEGACQLVITSAPACPPPPPCGGSHE